MKIRAGFVSNSSSSSFIVAFKKIPESEQELHEMLFGKEQYIIKVYDEYSLSTMDIAKRVFNDLKNKNEISPLPDDDSVILRDLITIASCGKVYHPLEIRTNKQFDAALENQDFDALSEIYKKSKKSGNPFKPANYDELVKSGKSGEAADLEHRAYMAWLREYISKWYNRYKNCHFYVFNYSDNDGNAGVVLEHGDIFRKLPNIRVWQH